VTHPLFNKDVSIVAPKDTITLKQLIKDIETLVEEYSESATEQTQYELENYEYDFS
jgi:phage terminase large subunit